ncbi:MAG: AI-2E family transporter [Pseudomonadota bacterium]|uniref:AI-2E family transporter n=1 Tax=Roseovarius TaxID=74030 RepID=UPI0022A89CCE|nr:AI-2E family transporter [Roseovarius sp. EGI FJ00037]MCZ0812639.1 AI-2E family transporter [Roseovarius sp. EGI FJ00037]
MHNPARPLDPVLRAAAFIVVVTLGFAILRTGGDILAPMVLGLVVGVILAPFTDFLERIRLPRGLAAAAVLVLGVMAIASLVFLAEPLVWRIAEDLPSIKWELRSLVNEFRNLIQGLAEMNREVEEALGASSENEDSDDSPAMPGFTQALFFAPLVLTQVLIFGGVLFFFLLTRKSIYGWLARFIGDAADTDIILQRFTKAERLVSRYFLTITVINTVLGTALAGALALIGLPGPFIWGLTAALANFILYMGPMMVTAGLVIAGLVAFDGLMTFLPAAIFLSFNMIESQFATPAFLGRHISVNPLLIFVSLVVWLWMWGPIGGIIAIPVLVIALVMLNVFDTLPDDAGEAQPAPPPGGRGAR